jgi:hypothetical protein
MSTKYLHPGAAERGILCTVNNVFTSRHVEQRAHESPAD